MEKRRKKHKTVELVLKLLSGAEKQRDQQSERAKKLLGLLGHGLCRF
jgi:hypothetical protein